MVSLNPEYGIEVSTLNSLADKVKDTNPELYTILTVISASIIGDDLVKLEKYCTKYLEDKVYESKLKNAIIEMIDPEKRNNNDNSNYYDF